MLRDDQYLSFALQHKDTFIKKAMDNETVKMKNS